ncbi:MAG TPA: epimerase [Cyanobacteria bacterium UBA9971]|nr:epimerase [Cyanobacteria bacterium UBA9971]
MKKKILLTGGSGFVGKNILESYLAEKYEIIAPPRTELNLFDEDSVDEFFLNKKFDIIIHAACKPGHRNAKDLSKLYCSNTKMFFHLVKHSDKFERMINLGSGAIYDNKNYKPKMKEEYFGQNIPQDEHGFCKYVTGKYILQFDKVVDLRIFGLFGKYEDYAIRFISNAICKTLFDLPITIKQNRKFDYVYINDLMPVLEHFIENKPKYNAYNVTPDESIELYELVEKIREISDKNLSIIVKEEGLGLEYSGDNSLLKNEIKNLKFTEIDKAIKELYEWYNQNHRIINKDCLLLDK